MKIRAGWALLPAWRAGRYARHCLPQAGVHGIGRLLNVPDAHMPDADGPDAAGILGRGRAALEVGRRTLVMGILNLTPDSFSGDGLRGDVEVAVRQAERMVAAGADLLDIGGESTRPGHEPVAAEVELARVLPLVERL